MKITLQNSAHRPYPPPTKPWMQEQVWDDLLFAHWNIPVEIMHHAVPPQLELDLWDGKVWLGIVPFDITTFRFRWLPSIPGFARFPEVNVRTYVTYKGKPGVWFFSLDAANLLAVIGARVVFHLPYFQAKMKFERQGEWIQYYSSRIRGKADFVGQYRPIGEPKPPVRGSLEYWLTERYCLYAVDNSGHVYSGDIHHGAWPLQAAELQTDVSTLAQVAGFELIGEPLLYFSKHQEVVVWPPVKLS